MYRYCQGFANYLQQENFSHSTLYNYIHALNEFIKWAKVSLENLTTTKIIGYKSYLNEKGYSIQSINIRLNGIRKFLHYLDYIDVKALPKSKITIMKRPERYIDVLTPQEIEQILNAKPIQSLKDYRDRALIDFLYSTGCRIGEVHSINLWEIDWRNKEVQVIGKGRKRRMVYFSERAKIHLQEYLQMRNDDQVALFTNTQKPRANGDMRLSIVSCEVTVREWVQLSGITKKVTCHTLRHSFATNMLRNGADIRSVQLMLGHDDIKTTQGYLHFGNQELNRTYNTFFTARPKTLQLV